MKIQAINLVQASKFTTTLHETEFKTLHAHFSKGQETVQQNNKKFEK